MIWLSLLLSLPLCAQPPAPPPASAASAPAVLVPSALAAEAQKKYDAADYHGAETDYRQLVRGFPADASYHYDLGNCLFKEGRLGESIASYQRAFDLDPRDSDIRYNLNFALNKAGEQLVPSGVPAALFESLYWFNIKELKGLQWIFCWLALLLAGLVFLRPAWRGRLKSWVLAAFALWAFWGGWTLLRAGLEPSQRGVIIKPAAEIRSGPGQSFSVSFTAPEGRRIEILSSEDGWLQIGLLKEGVKGWIEADAVEKI